ncbi:hypothetical protein FQN55_000088 [Onygenales sp. PD_40]|nr:hypothetical protein FQN55_000088 [Onygenales sp. PD_40]
MLSSYGVSSSRSSASPDLRSEALNIETGAYSYALFPRTTWTSGFNPGQCRSSDTLGLAQAFSSPPPPATVPKPKVHASRTPPPEELISYFIKHPTKPEAFGELGRRVQVLQSWIQTIDTPINTDKSPTLPADLEAFSSALFPYLREGKTSNGTTIPPLSALFGRHKPGSKGIVIPVGISSFRFATHLIGSIRNVLRSELPIEITYAGDADLPAEYRHFLTSTFTGVETVDIIPFFNDKELKLAGAGWAIKPFSLLASRFEKAILLDADSVLLQPPERIFTHHTSFLENGALLFHDRLLFKNAFVERQNWWRSQLAYTTPSTTWLTTPANVDQYSENGESGLVAVDMGRLPVFLGLLHIGWQNSKEARERVTYIMGHGDKESWWLGFELCGVPYSFGDQYGAVLGEKKVDEEKEKDKDGKETGGVKSVTRVCSFTIAHTDDKKKLLWLNGSLLKNKMGSSTEFWVPGHWMRDGVWEKGARKEDWSCMRDGVAEAVDRATMEAWSGSVEEAKRLDALVRPIVGEL